MLPPFRKLMNPLFRILPQWLRSHRRWLALGALALSSKAAQAETYHGPELAGLARQSIDVMRMHQHVIAQQLALDETPAFFELTARMMPATFQLDDGARMRAGIQRYGLSVGGGFGQPRTGFAGFIGMQVDGVGTHKFPNPIESTDEGGELSYGQGVIYAGLAAHGFQATYGLLMRDEDVSGLNPQGYFTRYRVGYRNGAPLDSLEMSHTSYSHFFTFTQAEGFSIGATLAEVAPQLGVPNVDSDTSELILAAIHAEFSPARLIDRLNLRERFGVPGIGLDRYAAQIDYWGDRYKEVKRRADEIARGVESARGFADSLGEAVQGSEAGSGEETWEIPIFLDDIAGTGLRARIIPQIRPTVTLRAIEGSYRYQTDSLKVGARSFAFQRSKALTGSGEAYVAVRPEFFKYLSIFGVPWMTLSYSFNTPDAATFLPIPNAHVFGMQWIYGRPEMGRPLIPLIAQHQREGED